MLVEYGGLVDKSSLALLQKVNEKMSFFKKVKVKVKIYYIIILIIYFPKSIKVIIINNNNRNSNGINYINNYIHYSAAACRL